MGARWIGDRAVGSIIDAGHVWGIQSRPVEQINGFTIDVRERLVDGAGLPLVDQVGGEVGNAMTKFVGDGVVPRPGTASGRCAIGHELAVPAGVVPGAAGWPTRADVHVRNHGHAGVIQAIAPKGVHKIIVGVAGIIVGFITCLVSGSRISFIPAQRGGGSARHIIVGIVGFAIFGGMNAANLVDQPPTMGIHIEILTHVPVVADFNFIDKQIVTGNTLEQPVPVDEE